MGNPLNIINGAIHTVTDLAQGKPLDAVKDFVSTAGQAAPLAAGLLPGGGIISGLLGSALGGVGGGAASGLGGLASSFLGAAGGLPNIASGLSSILPGFGGIGGILDSIFGGGKGGAQGPGQGTLDGSSLAQLKDQLSDQLNFQKQSDALIEAFKRASTIEGIKHQLTLGVLDKITA